MKLFRLRRGGIGSTQPEDTHAINPQLGPDWEPAPMDADIRSWAKKKGYDVPDRGVISEEVRKAYADAHTSP
jgi:hypothetical protein